MLLIKKKEAVSSSITDMLCLLITIMVIGIFMQVMTSYVYDLNLKKDIERVADSYQYIMESNGGLSSSEQDELINDLKALYNPSRNVGVTSVTLNSTNNGTNACYGKGGQRGTPIEFNKPMELEIKCTCNIYKFSMTNIWEFHNNVESIETVVKRKTISHGI